MFERFTERSRQVVILAQDEARAFGHDYIGTEHILLGLIREKEGLAAHVLDSLGVTEVDVHRAIDEKIGRGNVTTGQIPYTPRGKKVLELALREALSLGHNYIGTEHILLGLVREGGGLANEILRDRFITAEAVRHAVIQKLSGPGRRQASEIRTTESGAKALIQAQQKIDKAQQVAASGMTQTILKPSNTVKADADIVKATQLIADAINNLAAAVRK